MSSELLKRKKEIDAEFEEIMEMEDDSINVKSNMTIAAVAKLIAILDEHVTDLGEIANNKKYYDEGLTKALQNTVSELATAFSKIKAPEIKVTPNINIDISKPLQNIVDKINQSNGVIISLLNKATSTGGDKSEELFKLISLVVTKQNTFLEREFKQFDYTENFKSMTAAINSRPTEFKSKVTSYNDQNRIEEITTKITKF